MDQTSLLKTSLTGGYRTTLPFKCAFWFAAAIAINWIVFPNSALMHKLPLLEIFLAAFAVLMSVLCLVIVYFSIFQILWGDKPVIEFFENSVAYTNFRKMINIPYSEISGVKVKKYVAQQTITTLSIERTNSGVARINLNYLDKSAYEIMRQFEKMLPENMVDFSELDS
jgi:hypothetical protein